MSDLLRPCECESGFCNHLPNPFDGHICRQDTAEMAEELDKAHSKIESLQRENEALKLERDALRDARPGEFGKFLYPQQQALIEENERLRSSAITPEMREVLKRAFALAREVEEAELAEDLCGLLIESDPYRDPHLNTGGMGDE